jgi:uracil phosphoribosyltransferase
MVCLSLPTLTKPPFLTSLKKALLSILPDPVPVFHLGMYREKTTLQPVEYYNNLPYHSATKTSTQTTPSEIAILLDPIIATGATASAAIDTLKDWGVKRIVVCSVLASKEGLEKVSRVWQEGVQIWVGAVDPGTDARGMIKPGLGDVGDRLFLTIGSPLTSAMLLLFTFSLKAMCRLPPRSSCPWP